MTRVRRGLDRDRACLDAGLEVVAVELDQTTAEHARANLPGATVLHVESGATTLVGFDGVAFIDNLAPLNHLRLTVDGVRDAGRFPIEFPVMSLGETLMRPTTMLFRNRFSSDEREAGKAAMILGLCFISEGAIPFAAKDPLRVIPASIAGGALTGALSMYFGCKLMAPHGGLFVLAIPNAINHALLYLLAIVAGSLLTAVVYAAVKRPEAVELAMEPVKA